MVLFGRTAQKLVRAYNQLEVIVIAEEIIFSVTYMGLRWSDKYLTAFVCYVLLPRTY